MTWANLKVYTGITGAAIIGSLCKMLGGWDMWLEALVLFVILDYFSGLLAAFVEKKLNSEVGYRGVVKKVFIFILVAVAYEVDLLFGCEIFRFAVIGCYIGIEGLSILKNAGRAGLPLPKVLEAALEELQSRGDDLNATSSRN